MPQFFIRAHDGTDAEAIARRKEARPIHLEALKRYMDRIKAGGAILNAAGEPIGSIVIIDFEDRAALDAWLAKDPYITRGVWKDIEIQPYRPAVFDGKLLGLEAVLLDIASALLEAEARKAAEGPVRLLSFNFDLIRDGTKGDVTGTAEITRATRAAIFVAGKLTQGDEILATTTALFAILPQ